MYGFGEPLTKENILKRITSYDIFRYYSDNFVEVGKTFKGDLPGRDDQVPSAIVNMIGGDLMYSDFGYKTGLRCFDYVMEKLGLSYFDALQQINNDFNLGLGIYGDIQPKTGKTIPYISSPSKVQFEEKHPAILKKKQRPFTAKDLEYWNSFYWTEDMLKQSGTQSISHYWVNDYKFIVGEGELAFSYEYYYHNNRMQRKLYFPSRQKFKWVSNVDNTIVQLVDVMPKFGDVLFITSSKKDSGIFWRMNLDRMFPDLVIHGVAPNTEGAFVPEEWFHKMQTRWKRIILFYNNDFDKKVNTGINNSIKYSQKYNIEWYTTPDNTKKDPSDFAKEYGILEFKKLIGGKI